VIERDGLRGEIGGFWVDEERYEGLTYISNLHGVRRIIFSGSNGIVGLWWLQVVISVAEILMFRWAWNLGYPARSKNHP
jgi:hypothetical protein